MRIEDKIEALKRERDWCLNLALEYQKVNAIEASNACYMQSEEAGQLMEWLEDYRSIKDLLIPRQELRG